MAVRDLLVYRDVTTVSRRIHYSIDRMFEVKKRTRHRGTLRCPAGLQEIATPVGPSLNRLNWPSELCRSADSLHLHQITAVSWSEIEHFHHLKLNEERDKQWLLIGLESAIYLCTGLRNRYLNGLLFSFRFKGSSVHVADSVSTHEHSACARQRSISEGSPCTSDQKDSTHLHSERRLSVEAIGGTGETRTFSEYEVCSLHKYHLLYEHLQEKNVHVFEFSLVTQCTLGISYIHW